MQQLLLRRIVAICMTTACIVFMLPDSEALMMPGASSFNHSFTKRSFSELRCRGVFNKFIFGELNAVCQECYTIYKEPELHGLCRSDCFTSEYFDGCLQALMRAEETDKFASYIRRISGRK